jgi:hypothetical protein
MVRKIFVTFAVCMLLFSGICAQPCLEYYKNARCFIHRPKEFKQYGQARAATVIVGDTNKFEVVLYGQKDYIVTVCAEIGFKTLHFRIVNKQTRELIYDNISDDYNQTIGFTMEKTQNVIIELTILSDPALNMDPKTYRVCAGVQILWRKVPKTGFE